MAFKAGIGEADYAALRRANSYYVDKTELLYELFGDVDNAVTLFTRPRRFGKTLMMSMMENFFDIEKDSMDLFDGLAVAEHTEFCREWMNQYPVLFISLKDAEAESFDTAYDKLKNIIADVCKKVSNRIEAEKINQADFQIFERLMYNNASDAEVQGSLKTIMRILNVMYGKKVILLIDEYDVPISRASEKDSGINSYYTKMLDVIKGIMSISLKDNELLQAAVITGCLRIAKESIFTGTNNFASYSVLDDRYSQYFGFTEKEVAEMLEAADREEAAAEIKAWYDGYIFGDSYVYCPWDVINHIAALCYKKTARPKNYWKNTSHNGILLTFVKHTDFKVKGKFETLLNGGTIYQTITDDLTYDTLHSSEDNLWSVLLMTGYITKADVNDEGEAVKLKIPNKEISSIFEDTVVELFKETIDVNMQKKLMEAFWNRDTGEAERVVSELLWRTISYNDYHEDYYHAFLAGIFVGMGYEVESNKEKGLGRPDILLKDEDNRRAIIIEAKKSSRESKMDLDCDAAIDQIKTEKYEKGLYGYEQILCYGVAFFQKQAKVKLMPR